LTPVLGKPSLTAGGLDLPAAPTRLWLDRRAEKAAAKVSALMGGYVDPGFYLPKVLAIKNDEPELYGRTNFFLGCPEYLACALTAEARTVFPAEGFDRWFWNAAVLEKLRLDPVKLPPFIRPGEPFGPLLLAVAAFLGLPRGIPVIAGGPDFFAAILGAGACGPGQACDRAGTSEGINVCTERRITDRRLMSYGHPVKPFWNLSGIISTTGKAVEWSRDLLGLADYDELYALAAAAGAGAGGLVFLPYLAGERSPVWDPSARGVLRGLGLSSGRAEFARSVLEGICFAVRDVITVMEESGANVRELRVTGGAAESGVLNQIKADITGKELFVPVQKEAELLGLAIIGATALGEYSSFAEAASALVRIEGRFSPDEKNSALYGRLFQEYRETYRALRHR
jgi:xylulokinase